MEDFKNGIYDARKQLGMPKTIVLGLQHVFAMFGATVLVPLLTGLSVSVTLFCAGIATLWFHFITKGKVPVYLGSSFAFLGAFASVASGDPAKLPYATGGVLCAGLVYVVLAGLIQVFGVKKVMKLFPPIVTGPIIVLIGLILAPSALNNIVSSGQPARYSLAIIAIVVIIVCNIFGKGMVKILPILISIIVSYIVACVFGWVDFTSIGSNAIVALPPFFFPKFEIGAVVTFVVVSLAAIIEHVGDVAAVGATVGKNFIKDPGLTRTLLGDGIGTSIAGLLGGPANTTYSENTGVVALTGVYDPFVLRVAAVVALLLSLFPAVDGFINTIPSEIIGGISFVLYGMISAIGLRTLVEHKVDFANQRNVLIAAVIMVSGLAFNSQPIQISLGASTTLQFGGLASAAIFGIILNAILPGKDYEFES
ncbi:MAG: uracil-xanthine permease family protein [Eubacteriales bacterium]|nr:uracil-xanthine permease family protein [Eubacteriales bacterium]